MRGFASMPAADAMLHMWPWLRSSIAGRNCCAITIGAVVFMFMVRSMSRMLCLSKVSLLATMPALFITMSMLPHSFSVSAAIS